MPDMRFAATLMKVARDSIVYGARHGRSLPVDSSAYPSELQEARATFVTLKKAGELRGCIGGLEARRPLVEDVAESAFGAAYRDPRFPPLHEDEIPELELQISILSPLVRVEFASERDLLQQLRPGIDGLVLREGEHGGTFLPAVWSHLPEPESFLRELKKKAGLSPDHWSDQVEVFRYTSQSIS